MFCCTIGFGKKKKKKKKPKHEGNIVLINISKNNEDLPKKY